jgi:hypothetical protein
VALIFVFTVVVMAQQPKTGLVRSVDGTTQAWNERGEIQYQGRAFDSCTVKYSTVGNTERTVYNTPVGMIAWYADPTVSYTRFRGPHYRKDDGNYCLYSFESRLCLSADGKVLAIGAREVFSGGSVWGCLVMQLPKGEGRFIPFAVPPEMGVYGGTDKDNITIQNNGEYFVLSGDGTQLIYHVQVQGEQPYHNAAAIIAMDLASGATRRLMGYQSFDPKNRQVTVDPKSPCWIDVGRTLQLAGDQVVVVGRLPEAKEEAKFTYDLKPAKSVPTEVVRKPESVANLQVGQATTRPGLAQTLHAQGRDLLCACAGDPVLTDRAIALLEQAHKADKANDLYRLDLADAYVHLNTELALAWAIDLYEEVLKRQPEDRLFARVAMAYEQLGNFQTALDYAEKRLSVPDAQLYSAALQISQLALESGQHARGIKLLTGLVAKKPDDQAVKLLLATVLSEAGRKAEALRMADEAILKLPPGIPLAKEAATIKGRIQR